MPVGRRDIDVTGLEPTAIGGEVWRTMQIGAEKFAGSWARSDRSASMPPAEPPITTMRLAVLISPALRRSASGEVLYTTEFQARDPRDD
jgi:hypothetical protein